MLSYKYGKYMCNDQFWSNVRHKKESVMRQNNCENTGANGNACEMNETSDFCEKGVFESLTYMRTEYYALQNSSEISVMLINPFGKRELTHLSNGIIQLVVRLDSGVKIKYNICRQLKLMSSHKRITLEYIQKVAKKMKGMEFLIAPNLEIKNIKEIFAKCI